MSVSRLQGARQRAVPLLKSAGKFVLLTAVHAAPAGVAGWAVKSVAHRPLRLALGFVLEPLLSRLLRRASARFTR
ncbi:phage shock protein PspD [Pantoea sp. 1.19]|uniref:phage shock protein PspD n=1 Tax=Pantoea sp. 1.19 TaxID=1925589 RepID=UPI0009489475|nr:phage shock protein PspD [Pantoea sp. 1.19]